MNTYPVDNPVFFDLEVYPDWFLAGFMFPNGSYAQIENDALLIRNTLDWCRSVNSPLIGFNSKHYDDPVLTRFLSTGDPNEAYRLSLDIIEHDVPGWSLDNDIRSIDLMPVLPGRMSLKRLGVCLGHRKLQELPVDPHVSPSEIQKETLLAYNKNDLQITQALYQALRPDLELRRVMSLQYEADLRSKGEAQLAETAILRAAQDRSLENDRRKLNEAGANLIDVYPMVRVSQPTWWEELATAEPLRSLGESIFERLIPVLNGRLDSGSLNSTVYVDDRWYQMGVGGLHSIDGPGAWIPADDELLLDLDVASYYPNLILTQRLFPRQWGEPFLSIYGDIVARRMKAKREGDADVAYILKIAANGVFGKSSDLFSSLYDPQLTVNVTVLGQLGLLSLIQMLAGVATICSANTDGITILIKRHRELDLAAITHRWQQVTGLELERTDYKAFYQRDVNNYIAVKSDGSVKSKGRFINKWPDLRHMPNANIIATALQNLAAGDTPIEKTVHACRDLNQFLLTQNVASGWRTQWNGKPLGNVLRFYKSNAEEAATITRTPAAEGIKGREGAVPDSERCRPVEDLPETLPEDINYRWYTEEAAKLWDVISRPKRPGMNRWAHFLELRGYRPCMVNPAADILSRARVTPGGEDFTSLPPGWMIGTGTGDALLARVSEHATEVWKVLEKYPSRTRKKIQEDHGFTLYYGARVPLRGIPRPVRGSDPFTYPWDRYYTAAELDKVRGKVKERGG